MMFRMAWDWLFGPRDVRSETDHIRGLVLDIETLPELASEVHHWIENHTTQLREREQVIEYFRKYEYTGRTVDVEEIPKLHDVDRNALAVETGATFASVSQVVGSANFAPAGGITVFFRSDRSSINITGSQVDLPLADLHTTVVEFLYRKGVQRVDWRRVFALVRFVPAVAALVSWLWLALTVTLPLAVHVFMLAVVVTLVIVGVQWYRDAMRRVKYTPVRTIYRGESREKTWARRADRRRDIRVAVLGVLGGLALAFIIWAVGAIAGASDELPVPTPSSVESG